MNFVYRCFCICGGFYCRNQIHTSSTLYFVTLFIEGNEQEKDFHSVKGQKFGHLNIHGLRSKFEEFKHSLVDSNFLLFTLNEANLDKHCKSSRFEIPGYDFLRFGRKGKSGVGPVFIFEIIVLRTPIT